MMPTINSLIGSPVTANTCYIRSSLLSVNSTTVSVRERSHNYQLLGRTTVVNDKNFIMRMLYKDVTFND